MRIGSELHNLLLQEDVVVVGTVRLLGTAVVVEEGVVLVGVGWQAWSGSKAAAHQTAL